ncbi:bifunctional diaminohydroxyphosphoribosylaminopyrimidine deaminase/5-amino-6-(5-phosphoribosylamino)uracil reductase [Actinobacillus succinogenes]|uniref:Riboflavin biosynthesis protein RibD n=1 Tax=Actinobacillus succinogenes (strain ATCC 55618 / DSM 22257 / CCUG 43843 / 130Z) TaxID=339671 RepID=A6VP31_ACTSZ|nr:bifunctional diaminohydroxyphosphoribosylaminopyrimidine deaminase/5-amino-6-(5-phosphoribosylamino)uracil reductase RibD [Actinobacillus succinogenes]ABR74728.1 riboflavin biosynthesis protein RibD [Actinobacillus succinogenes 130Z]PHI40852.1 bifunctional diaminohydroxyphosphoribosylaminopyrimidine deaminase/5-amino-6-(5-phosphoribosylamino)uracil reductase [Actinobacillus succinogenes]
MTAFTEQDQAYMQLALDLARRGRFTTTPNPNVGCVLVKHNKIVGTGFHFRAGEPHAEVMAIRDAGDNTQGATAYVTLEPCSHYGRTPPCAQGLINAGVTKVIIATQDPNPQVAGRGLKMLQDAGIESAVGLLAEKAEAVNLGFLKRMRTGMPFVQLKLAMSLDGRTAMASGESKWITGEAARADVQEGRAQASAILSTAETVLADDPQLNVRWEQLPQAVQIEYSLTDLRQPIRVILDRRHRVQPHHRLFRIESPVWLVSEKPRDMSAFPAFCEHIQLKTTENPTALYALMQELGKRQINTIWVEAGATLAGALIEQNLADELIIYMAPKLLGHQARGLCKLPHLTRLADAPQWTLQSAVKIGEDLKTVYTRKSV